MNKLRGTVQHCFRRIQCIAPLYTLQSCRLFPKRLGMVPIRYNIGYTASIIGLSVLFLSTATAVAETFNKDKDNLKQNIDGVYEFIIPWINGDGKQNVDRKFRIYLYVSNETNKVYMSLTEPKPINGFEEYTLSVAQFHISSVINNNTNDIELITKNGYTKNIGYFKNEFILNYNEKDDMLYIDFKLERNEEKNHHILLNKIDLDLDEKELAKYSWVPYTKYNESVSPQIWRSDILNGLNVYDIDIFYPQKNCGCWGWVDENNDAINAITDDKYVIGTAGGDNFEYKYPNSFDGCLKILRWNDYGDWIPDNHKCHKGTSFFMIIDKDKAWATWQCDDGLTGGQMLMKRMKKKMYSKDLKCPIIEKKGINIMY